MGELQEIIDELVIIQQVITPPTGEKDLVAYDEPPGQTMIYPCFLNVERETGEIGYAPSLMILPYIIDMHFIFGTADRKYAYRSKRKWVKAVRDAFAAKLTLNGKATEAQLLAMNFHPSGLILDEESGQKYDAITFVLRATVKEAIAYTV